MPTGIPTASGGSISIAGEPVTIGGLTPVLVENVEADLDGNVQQIKDQCGRTETRRSGNSAWNITVEGLVDDRQLESFLALAETDDTISVTADVLGSRSGQKIVDKCTITHEDETNSIKKISDAVPRQVYPVQVQLIDPATQSQSGG